MIVLHGGPRGGDEVDEKIVPSNTEKVQVGDAAPGSSPVMQDFLFVEVPDALGNILRYRVEGDSGVFCGVKPKA